MEQTAQGAFETDEIHAEFESDSLGSFLKLLFDPRQWFEKRARMVLLGITGAGKSTLGIFLIFGEHYPDQGGFGMDYYWIGSRPTVCQSLTCKPGRWKMTVYDTPGVPDTDGEKSLERFNEVVRTV